MRKVSFGGKCSYADFNMVLDSRVFNFPETKTAETDIPGADGVIDLTDVLSSSPKYGMRTLQYTFNMLDSFDGFDARVSAIANYLHGQKMAIVNSWDQNYYWYGRCSVNAFKTDKRSGQVVIDCVVDPYKYEVGDITADWPWDPFNFINGVIYTAEVTVSGQKTVNLPGSRKQVSPTFDCSAACSVIINGVTKSLPAGKSTPVDIILKNGDNWATFSGNADIEINYERGSL